MKKWDQRYLRLARFWAEECSKDPSTKVGAVLVSEDGQREYLGYNGFPRGVKDTEERLNNRELKYPRIVHAEANAILKAGHDARGSTLYVWPLFTCNECAQLAIQAGVSHVVAPHPAGDRWQSAYTVALEMYRESGVTVQFVAPDSV